jgi:hypothetical protein
MLSFNWVINEMKVCGKFEKFSMFHSDIAAGRKAVSANSRKSFMETPQLLVKSINIKQSDPIREMCCIRAGRTFLAPRSFRFSSKSKSHP